MPYNFTVCTLYSILHFTKGFYSAVTARSRVPEMSLILPDFTIAVNGSSCNYLLFFLILCFFLTASLKQDGMPRSADQTYTESRVG